MTARRRGPWRQPAEETVGLYGPFVVHDGRVTGSITFDRTRLPIWAPHWPGPTNLGDYTQPDAPTDQWAEAAAALVRRLLGLRGEFARLLLVLAAAEDTEETREEAVWDTHFAEAHSGGDVCRCGTVDYPAWWDVDELRAPVVDQLRRCLAALGED